MTFIVGLLQGNVGFFDIAMAVGDGMADMFSISIVAILVSGVIGLVRYYGGIEWMIDTITKKIKNRKQAKISTRLARRFGAILYLLPISFAIGQVTMIAIVLLTIAPDKIPERIPIPYSACFLDNIGCSKATRKTNFERYYVKQIFVQNWFLF